MCATLLAVAVGPLGTAAARKPTAKTSSGLGCLVGKWISNGIQSGKLSGLAGAVLTIQRSGANKNYVIADTNYDHATPLRIAGTTGYSSLEGSVFAKIYYKGHGNYTFTAGVSSEEETVYGAGIKLFGPIPVAHPGGFSGLKCTAATLSTTTTVPTGTGGQVTVGSTFRRTH